MSWEKAVIFNLELNRNIWDKKGAGKEENSCDFYIF